MEEHANTLAERKDCYFSLLPDEVIVLILSYLETVPAKLGMELVASRFTRHLLRTFAFVFQPLTSLYSI